MSSSSPSSSAPSPSSAPPGLRLALIASALLLVAGLVAFGWASRSARQAPPKAVDHAVTVTIRGQQCEPNEITVPAGRTSFTIVNASQRTLEWEILDGVMVVEERENIAPGFSQTLTAKLKPGDYAITCGLLSNPRGILHVLPSAASEAEAARPALSQFVGALAEYRVYLALEAIALQEQAEALNRAIQSGDLAQAQALYATAHQSYKRIEPMADLFADLDARLNARAEYFGQREADAAFSGFHRIEYALFAQRSLAGLAPVGAQLLQDIASLQARLQGLSITPERLAPAAAKLLQRVADNLPAGGDERYGPAERSNLQGTLEGTQKIDALLAPLLDDAQPALQQRLLRQFSELEARLAAPAVQPLDAVQREVLVAPLRALAASFAQINPALGLD